ncbi:MAG: SCO family protein [Alphaproteobacteria bacterium]|nr:SCO family protein [Alphaproteobacteria bacterium]
MPGLTRPRLLAIVLAVIAGVGIGAISHLLLRDGGPASVREVVGLGDPAIGGPFRLIDSEGRERSDADFRSKLMLVEFGYTFCPDVCPLGLQLFADILDRLGPAADEVAPVFITLDPARDTPEILKSYVQHFSPRITALTGSREAIDATVKAYRVYYRLASDAATNPNYLVDHSAILYLMGRDGKFLTHFTHETPPDRVVAAIRSRL